MAGQTVVNGECVVEGRTGRVRVPGVAEPLDLSLPPRLEALRNRALEKQEKGLNSWGPALELVEAMLEAWRKHTPGEDWQLWRARRFAARIKAMPLELESGEPVVGKALLRHYSEEEKAECHRLLEEMKDCPPFPGGDNGHFHPNYEKVLRLGVGGMLEEIDSRRTACAGDRDKTVFYDACEVAMKGFQAYVRRVADGCRARAAEDPDWANGWRERAATCDHVAADPPETFHQACQLMYLVFAASWTGEEHIMTCYGRMDRTLGRFYEADVRAGRITAQEAMEILAGMYIQINRICPYGLADGVIVGGRDGAGRDVTNTVTYLCLAARWATWLCYPTLAIAWHEETPDALMDFCMTMLAGGLNDPAFYNDGLIAAGMQDHGVSREDAHNFMNSTCVEIKAAGTSHIWVATEYVNCPGALLEAMRREAEGECAPAAGLAELEQRTREILTAQVKGTAARLDGIWTQRGVTGCLPFASCLIDDCLERGLDHDRGGCRYHWAENSYVGLANLADSLVAVDELVYRSGEMTLADFYAVCRDNFEGHEPLRQRILNTMPKYGNDDDAVDRIATAWADFLSDMTESFPVGGHRYVPGFFCHVNHMLLGDRTGATPGGRLAGKAFADGAGAAQGRERSGPTAGVLSTTKWSHRKALGGLVQNVRFSRSMLETAATRKSVRSVIETYLRRGGFEIQVNVLSAETLRKAKAQPEEYKDLVVRVAGYSDYFTKLPEQLQEEVIARTEFGG
jgi:formate C-acetyltransferase